MTRDVTPEPARDRLDELRAMLRVRCHSLFGHPWVTFADVEEAIKIMRAVPPATPLARSAVEVLGTMDSVGPLTFAPCPPAAEPGQP